MRRKRRSQLSGVRVVRLALLVAWGTSALLASAQAQQPVAAPAPAPAAATPPQPRAIPAAEITAVWQSTQAKLKTIQDGVVAGPAEKEVRTSLEEVEKTIADLSDTDGLILTVTITPDNLMTVQNRWQARADTYAQWSADLSDRVKELGDDLAVLDQEQASWSKTGDDAEANGLAKPVVERIQDTIAAIEATRMLARDRQNTVLTLQDRVAKLTDAAATVLTQVDDVRRAQKKNLLMVDSVALWTAVGRGDYERESIADSVVRSGAQAYEFFEAQAERTATFIVVIVAMMAVVTFLRARASRWVDEDENLAPLLASLSRPISGGFLLAAVSFPWFFPERPEVIAALVSLLIIPPLIRFLSPLVVAPVRRALYGLAIWMVVDLVRGYLVPDPLVNRLVLLGEGVAVSVALVWLLRPARLGRLDEATRWLWVLGLGLRLSLAIIVVAMIANVVGNVTLAQMLTRALVSTLFMAAVLVAAGHVLEFMLILGLRARMALRLGMVRRRGALIRERCIRLVRLGLAVIWFWIALRRFQVAGSFEQFTDWILNSPIGAGDFEVTLGHFVGAVVVIVVSVFLARFIRFVLDEDVLPRTSLPRGVPYTVSVLAGYSVILLGSFAAVAAAGIDMSRFALVLSALSVGIGIGLQDVVNNFVSGLILLFERPLNVGDTVEVAHVKGEIRHIGLRSSTVRTWDGSEVVIPNSRFIADQFTNWTLSDRTRRIEIAVGVAYGSDPVRVIECLVGVAQDDEKILREPQPVAIMTGFGESSLDFSLRAWTGDIDSWTSVQSGLLVEIGRRLAAAGIEIPFPQRDLHIVEGEPPPPGSNPPA